MGVPVAPGYPLEEEMPGVEYRAKKLSAESTIFSSGRHPA